VKLSPTLLYLSSREVRLTYLSILKYRKGGKTGGEEKKKTRDFPALQGWPKPAQEGEEKGGFGSGGGDRGLIQAVSRSFL